MCSLAKLLKHLAPPLNLPAWVTPSSSKVLPQQSTGETPKWHFLDWTLKSWRRESSAQRWLHSLGSLPPTDPRTPRSSQEMTSQSPHKEDLEADDWPPAQQWPGVTPRPLHTTGFCQGSQEVTRVSWVPQTKVKATTEGTNSEILSHSGQLSHSVLQLWLWRNQYKGMDNVVAQMYGQCQSHLFTTTQKVIFQTGWQLPKRSTENVFCKQLPEQPIFRWKDNLTN